ncbi:cytochrome c-type biogenesis protein CcmC [Vibrio ponticus]|nr:cytochrome c-type biogenesis protein CcmC [Vibrio ponticus]
MVNLPIIHFSVEWWNTLHQGATITKFAKPSISNDMLWPLLLNIFGFAFFFGAVTLVRLRNEIISKESHRPWVVDMSSRLTQRGN